MLKQEFLDTLKKKLSELPKKDIIEHLNFYSEMIDDRIEDGISEKEAVSQIGSVDVIASQIVSDMPISKLNKENPESKKHFKVWTILLLALGSPIWISLIISFFAIVISLYISLWAIIISLWAVFASLIGCAIGGIIGCAIIGNGIMGVVIFSAGILCLGLAIFFFFGCKIATKSTLLLTKKSLCALKMFYKKG